MLYVVTLTYIQPVEKISAHLDSHKDWLVSHIRSGSIITAGPMEPATGGVVVMSCADRSTLDAILKLDSFHQNKLVAYDVRAFTPALRADAFSAEWAPNAKPIAVSHS